MPSSRPARTTRRSSRTNGAITSAATRKRRNVTPPAVSPVCSALWMTQYVVPQLIVATLSSANPRRAGGRLEAGSAMGRGSALELDLDEGELVGVRVDHVVLDRRDPRVRSPDHQLG